MALSETKLSDTSVQPELPGYKFESVNSPTQAGGVALYVSNNFDYRIREDLNLGINNCEDLWIEIEFNSQENKRKRIVIIAVVYRHPGPHYKQFSDALSKNLSLISQQKTKALIVGDTNIDLAKFSITSNVTNYVHLLCDNGFNCFIDKPTRITSHSATCIDHVYSNIDSEDINSVIIESDISDHFSTLTCVQGYAPQKGNGVSYYRNTNLNPENWELFNSELQYILACNLASDTEKVDVNKFANHITDTYKSLINKYMPLRRKTRKQKNFGTALG